MRKHHTTLILSAIAVAALLIGGPARAQGIDGSDHDLATGVGDNNEVCVYCHTPHAANVAIEAPLWNKPASGATYTTYDSTTIDGDILAVGSVSIACLSCHDGTMSTDVVINAPGSGGVNPAGVALRGGNQFLSEPQNLGTDLTNDHPIGVQYGGFDPGSGQIDPDFINSTNGLQVATINNVQRWWVDTEATPNASRDKTDMILYTRDNAGANQPFVECASCHDPHNNVTGTFLRISNANSAVCQACHVK
jgi:predicted CXXCH cytochrome family protein